MNQSNIVETSFRPNLIVRFFERISAWNDRRVAIVQLNAMSDRMLRDIGISRHQIKQAVKCPADFATLSTPQAASPETLSEIQRAA